MKNATPRAGARRDSTADNSLAVESAPSRPYSIKTLAPCDYGTKRATGTIVIDGIGEVDIELFRLEDGRAFVAGLSVRDKYGGRWTRTVRFDDTLADDLLAAVSARLDADGDGGAA